MTDRKIEPCWKAGTQDMIKLYNDKYGKRKNTLQGYWNIYRLSYMARRLSELEVGNIIPLLTLHVRLIRRANRTH